MENKIFDKMGADDPLQMKAFVEQMINYCKCIMQVMDEDEQLRQRVAQQDENIAKLEGKNAEQESKNAELEMRLSELSKLSAGVARKSSQDELLKALRTFVNKSKRKRIEKRTAVKEMVMELAIANSIVFPEDLATTIDALDDEQSEPKVVNVTGNYNDIHDNGSVGYQEEEK